LTERKHKINTPFCSQFSRLLKTRRLLLMILPVRGATTVASVVNLMWSISQIGT